MEQFLNDIKAQSTAYYDALVNWTPKLIFGTLVLLFFIWLSSIIKRIFLRYLAPRVDDHLLGEFLSKVLKILVVVIGILFFLSIIGLGKAATSMLAGAGVTAFIIGFAFKDIGENFLAGIIMAFDRPFRIGDVVLIAGHEGKIDKLTLRDTHMKTFDGKDVYIPNGIIVKNPIVNYTIDGFLRHQFQIRLANDSDVKKAIEIILETLSGIDHIIDEDRKPNVFIQNINHNAFILSIQYWLRTDDPAVSGVMVKTTAMNGVVRNLRDAGFTLPNEMDWLAGK